ncbi:MAG TPA: ABC transporter permease [Rubrobacter sp.]|nr:ABC transporter permease [Rubrobacter sp.]
MADNASAKERASGGSLPRFAGSLLGRPEAGIFVVAILLSIYFQASNPAFLTGSNLLTLSQTVAPIAIMAAGLVMVMILGEIDLSVGQTFGFAPIVAYLAYEDLRLILPLAVVVGLLVTGGFGFINGAVRVYLGVPSFVVTLGTFFLIGGLNVILLGGFPANAPGGAVRQLLGAKPNSEIIWCVVIIVVMHILLTHTRWGLRTFATGGNFIGAREAGIKVDRVRIGNFVLCAVLAGFAGILEAFRIGSIDPLAGGADIMFFAIAAAVIGGTPLAGGVGTIIGAFLGALVYSELKQGFTLLGVNANAFSVIIGIAVLVVMVLNIYVGRLRKGRRIA